MEKTIKQALIDDIHYPISEGCIENKLVARGIDPSAACTGDILNSNSYKGAYADCLFSLIDAPSISEAGKSISLGDKSMILKKVNSIYSAIGEHSVGEPMVYMGKAAFK